MTVYDEIQARLYEQYQSSNRAEGLRFRLALKVRPCALCDHDRDNHSQILALEPCLDCDCAGWTAVYRPDPMRVTR